MKKRNALCLSLLILASLASCTFLPKATPPGPGGPAETEIARVVEQTLQAVASQAAPALTPVETQPPAPASPAPASTATPSKSKPTKAPGKSAGAFWVAYTLAGDVYAWKPGGSTIRLTKHGQARNISISPDGAWIAYTKQTGDLAQELWAVRPDGSEDRPLVTAADLPSPHSGWTLVPADFDWIPGTHQVLYTDTELTNGPGSPPLNDLRRVDADTLEKKTLLEPGQGGHFVISPDGQKILLVQGDRILAANLDGSSARQLFSFPAVSTYSEWVYLPDPVWVSNSTAFRVIIPPQDPMAHPDDTTIVWEIPIDGSPARQMASFAAAPAWHYRPLLSPDGSRIAYQTPQTGGNQLTELHIAYADRTGDRMYVSGQIHFDSWSPDGKRFAITREDRSGMQIGTLTGNLYSFPVGIKPYRLTWIDSNQFLVLSGSPEAPELYMTDSAGRISPIATATSPNIEYDFVR